MFEIFRIIDGKQDRFFGPYSSEQTARNIAKLVAGKYGCIVFVAPVSRDVSELRTKATVPAMHAVRGA